jgi:hypothetical protein
MTTNYREDLGTSQADDHDSPGGAKEQAKQAASTAADQASNVAKTAKDEAGRVASEATSQLRSLLDEATSQVEQQSAEQQSRLAATVRSFADDLGSMSSQSESSGVAAEVLQRVAAQADQLAGRLEDQQPRELLDDVRRFARRRPGTFLVGALAAGVLAGRLTRGARESQRDSATSPGTDTGTGTGTTIGTGSTFGTPGPAPSAGAHPSAGTVAPIPPTDDDASPAYLSDGGDAGPSYLGTEHDVTAPNSGPGTTDGPGTGRS